MKKVVLVFVALLILGISQVVNGQVIPIGNPGNSSEVVIQGKSLTVNSVTTTFTSGKVNTNSISANGNVSATGWLGSRLGLEVGNNKQFSVDILGGVRSNGINNNGKQINNVADGVDVTDAVNKGQLDYTKAEAIFQANLYTDAKVDELNGKIDAETNERRSEISRVDSKINKTNQAISDLDVKLTSQTKKLDDKIDRIGSKLTTEVERLDEKIDRNDRELRQEIKTQNEMMMQVDREMSQEMHGLGATMMAMGAMQTSTIYNPKKKGNLSFGTGTYRHSVAFAAGGSYYASPSIKLSAVVAGGTNTKLGAGAGISFGF